MKLQNEKILIYEQKKAIRQIRWLIFWVLISLNVVTLSIDAVFSFMSPPSPALNYARMMFTHILAVLLPLIIFFKIRDENSQKISLRLNKISFKQIFVITILAIAGQFIMAISNMPLQMLAEIPLMPAPRGGFEIFMAVIAITIVPSILEEVLFRGVMFSGLEKQSTLFAAAFSTFIFALLHPNILNFFGYVFLGMITVMVMLRTNSLYAAILYHFINNLTAFIFGFIASQTPLSLSFIIWLLLSSIIIFVVTLFIFRLVTPNAPRYKSKNTASLLLSNILSVPIILCIALTVVIQYIRFMG